jgi:hypothetical protein
LWVCQGFLFLITQATQAMETLIMSTTSDPSTSVPTAQRLVKWWSNIVWFCQAVWAWLTWLGKTSCGVIVTAVSFTSWAFVKFVQLIVAMSVLGFVAVTFAYEPYVGASLLALLAASALITNPKARLWAMINLHDVLGHPISRLLKNVGLSGPGAWVHRATAPGNWPEWDGGKAIPVATAVAMTEENMQAAKDAVANGDVDLNVDADFESESISAADATTEEQGDGSEDEDAAGKADDATQSDEGASSSTEEPEKSFRCPHCDSAYQRKSNLTNHVRRQHGDVVVTGAVDAPAAAPVASETETKTKTAVVDL